MLQLLIQISICEHDTSNSENSMPTEEIDNGNRERIMKKRAKSMVMTVVLRSPERTMVVERIGA